MMAMMEQEEIKSTRWRFAEQDFLNVYFQNRWKAHPYKYNAQKRIKLHHPSLWNLNDVAVLHYIDDKPWTKGSQENELYYKEEVELWWRIFHGPTFSLGPHSLLKRSNRCFCFLLCAN